MYLDNCVHVNRRTFPTMHPVSVIASFSPSGKTRVDAWGIELDGKRYRYKVESSELIEKVDAYLKFRCLYVEHGLLKSVDLFFRLGDCSWSTG